MFMFMKNLAKARKVRGWSQEKLAAETGVSYNTIIKIERGGIKNSKIETVIKIAKALGMSLDDLIINNFESFLKKEKAKKSWKKRIKKYRTQGKKP